MTEVCVCHAAKSENPENNTAPAIVVVSSLHEHQLLQSLLQSGIYSVANIGINPNLLNLIKNISIINRSATFKMEKQTIGRNIDFE
jgi:hypothetical protein